MHAKSSIFYSLSIWANKRRILPEDHLGYVLLVAGVGLSINSFNLGLGFPMDQSMMEWKVVLSSSIDSRSDDLGIPRAHCVASHSGVRATDQRYLKIGRWCPMPFFGKWVAFPGGYLTMLLCLSLNPPRKLSFSRNSSIVTYLKAVLSFIMASRWKNEWKSNTDFAPFTVNLICCPRGNTKVRPIAIAITRAVSKLIRTLFQPAKSGSTIKYFSESSFSVVSCKGTYIVESRGMSQTSHVQTISSTLCGLRGPPWSAQLNVATECASFFTLYNSSSGCRVYSEMDVPKVYPITNISAVYPTKTSTARLTPRTYRCDATLCKKCCALPMKPGCRHCGRTTTIISPNQHRSLVRLVQ